MFSDSEKLIFEYDPGDGRRVADPYEVRRALVRYSGGQFWQWLAKCGEDEGWNQLEALDVANPEAVAMARATLLQALDCQERCLGVIREAFKLPPPVVKDGVVSGYPEKMCWKVWAEYDGWMEKNESGAGD